MYRPLCKALLSQTRSSVIVSNHINQGIKDQLLVLERRIISGDTRGQLECLNFLAANNLGMLDDRVLSSLTNVRNSFIQQCFDCETTMKYVVCLHRFKDATTLREMLPHLSHGISFMSPSDLTQLTRIYAIHTEDPDELKVLRARMIKHLAVHYHSFKIDELLGCLLSCFDASESQELAHTALQSYMANLGELSTNSFKTLQTVLTALRLYRRVISCNRECAIPDLVEISLRRTLACLNNLTLNIPNITISIRICYILAALSDEATKPENYRLAKTIWEAGRDATTEVFTAKDSLYLLHSLKLLNVSGMDMSMWLLCRIKPQLPMMAASEMILLLDCVENDKDYILMQRFMSCIDDLNNKEFVTILKFYSNDLGLPSVFKEGLRSRFCKVCKGMEPKEFTSSFNYLINMKMADTIILSSCMRYIYNHYIDFGTKDIATILDALGKVRFRPPQRAIDLLYQVLRREINNFGIEELTKCIRFSSLHRNQSKMVFEELMTEVKKKLQFPTTPGVLCRLTWLLNTYRNRRFNALLYSTVFEALSDMSLDQLAIVLRSYLHTRLGHDNFTRKICHYIRQNSENVSDKALYNIQHAMLLGYRNGELLMLAGEHGAPTSIQGLLMQGGKLDVGNLSGPEVFQWLCFISNKTEEGSNRNVVKLLCNRLRKISKTMTPGLARMILQVLNDYGYMKPKITRILTNRIGSKTSVTGNGDTRAANIHVSSRNGTRRVTMFRRIELGPPHLDLDRVT